MSEFEIAVNNARAAIAASINTLTAVSLTLDELQGMAGTESALRKGDRTALMAVVRTAEVERDQAIREKVTAEARVAALEAIA
jgi:hypothetical protein